MGGIAMRHRRALSPTQLLMLTAIQNATTPLTVHQLTESTQAAVETIREAGMHLSRKGLIVREYVGGLVYYSTAPAPIAAAAEMPAPAAPETGVR